MEEKQKKSVAKNLSSGAEKVERVEKSVKTQKTEPNVVETQTVTQKQAAASEEVEKKVEKENAHAKKRVDAALKKKEKKAKKAAKRAKLTAAERKARAAKAKAERKERMEKRLAERKAAAAKKRAERKAATAKKRAERKANASKRAAARKEVLEKLRAEEEAWRRERAHKKANRTQKKEKGKRERAEKKQPREHRRKEKGYGGWLAAVIALGAVTLGLTTAVTVGALEMKDMQNNATRSAQSTTYELVGIMEHVDDDLDRARIAATPTQQQRILTDLLVQTRLAELDLEKLPMDSETDKNVTTFINRVGGVCERMLAKLRRGESLSQEDEATLQRLYETNHSIRGKLDEYLVKMTDKDVSMFIKKGEGAFADMWNGLEKLTLEENRAALEDKMQGAGMQPKMQAPEENQGGSPKLDTAQAEEICKRYFDGYHVAQFQCVGETLGQSYAAYNVQGYDEAGTLLFAEIDCNDGELIRFDYYAPCSEEKFDIQNAETIAQNFLEKLGYEDMTAVRTRENGTDADFTFVYETDGVVYYPDTVRVKVCRERGVVTGFDASKYLQNHTRRTEVKTQLTMQDAQAKLHEGLAVEFGRLAVVKSKRGERAAYEFLCSYMDEKYLVYTDAINGEEIAIVNVKNL
ncbi:MAG: hypothetical protein E7355_02265 [Clostridiales bacterium]|nr:hypothetical protein [Clostridiales bacterium]